MELYHFQQDWENYQATASFQNPLFSLSSHAGAPIVRRKQCHLFCSQSIGHLFKLGCMGKIHTITNNS